MPNTLVVIINEHQVKDRVALDFMLEVFSVVKIEKGSSAVLTLFKTSGLDKILDQLFPANKRTPENIKDSFTNIFSLAVSLFWIHSLTFTDHQ